jgi:tRNA(Arg) A34 adenosine deaminase TadA
MLDMCKNNYCDDTIHSEVNLISSFYNNYNKEEFKKLSNDLVFITSSRPCLNCSYVIKTFNQKLKSE